MWDFPATKTNLNHNQKWMGQVLEMTKTYMARIENVKHISSIKLYISSSMYVCFVRYVGSRYDHVGVVLLL